MKYRPKPAPSLIFLALPALFALNPANTAVADDILGSLGHDRTAIDVYQVHCFDDGRGVSDRMVASIRDLTPVARPLVSLQIASRTQAINTTDRTDGDTASSPLVTLRGGGTGNDFYLMSINKTHTGEEIYSVVFHCLTFDNQHTGTAQVAIIDQ